MEDLEKLFLRTFPHILTSSDKKELKQALHQAQANENTRAWLRNRFFSWVQAKITNPNDLQVIHWLEEVNKILLIKTENVQPATVYFSPGEACLDAIISQLRSAVHTIQICVFTISDDRISDTIIDCHRLGKQVFIITDNEKLHDAGSDIERLEQAGIPVRIDKTSDHMHHKFAIIDKEYVLTGSYNWTRSAAKYNHENILITSDKQAVEAFEHEFERLWQNLAVY
ncbi:DUF1669 domain-containing protein [Rhodocytophaga rosea]|uniref:phospholipase D n=1 Tax=Rhodocytophaga rosea TaxID=2704465 RepID=A0A6C0GSX6_9BACT|nr:phospholipase D-like domain-containing protein [Rhodocytophaga rosea]QHT70997.1 DUF1669 domain-containing protein [Rhodocytophaga rosea]